MTAIKFFICLSFLPTNNSACKEVFPRWRLRRRSGAKLGYATCVACRDWTFRGELLRLPYRKDVRLLEAATYQSIPGHPQWGFAPLSMTWEGKSLGEICRRLKDVQLNGGSDLVALQEHIAKDDLEALGMESGEGRKPAPGSQEAAGKLVQVWIESGAECPRLSHRTFCKPAIGPVV